MQVVLEIKNPNELQLLLQYVKLLSSVRVVDPKPKVLPTAVKKTFFEQHYGAIRSNMSNEEIDTQINKLRDERERDTW